MQNNTFTIVAVLLTVMLLPKCEAKPPVSPRTAPTVQTTTASTTRIRLLYDIVERVNRERTRLNLLPLKLSSSLVLAAENHAQAMVENHYFDTLTPDGRSATAYAFAQGFDRPVGQNLYRGEADPDAIVSAWLNDEIDCDNLLDPTRSEVGVGYATSHDSFGAYIVLDVGQRQRNYPVVINQESYETTDPRVHLSLYGEGTIKKMRFSNDGVHFTDWEPFQSEREWVLPSEDGEHTVYVELSDGFNTFSDSDDIRLYRHFDGKNLGATI